MPMTSLYLQCASKYEPLVVAFDKILVRKLIKFKKPIQDIAFYNK